MPGPISVFSNGISMMLALANDDRFKYTGRKYDVELGIYYYRPRYYDPAMGRFLGEDPKGFGARDANFYRYVGDQPTG